MKDKVTKTHIIFGAVALMLIGSCSKSNEKISKSDLKTLKDSASYAYGYLNGKQAKKEGNNELNADIFASAFKEGYIEDSASKPMFTDEQCMEILETFARKQQESQYDNIKNKAKANIDAAEKFLKKNKGKQGVKTTASGLQYKVVKQGKGIKPKAGNDDRIRFKYELSILDNEGKIIKIQSDFDNPNSTSHLQGIDNFIQGFTEAVQMMNAGSRYTVWIHPKLGYGLQDSPDIPAGSLLIFDIEVDEVLPGDEE